MTPPAKKTHSESTYFLRSSTKNQGTRQQKDPLVHPHKLAPIQETGQGERTLVDHKQLEKSKKMMEDKCVDDNIPNTGTDSAIIYNGDSANVNANANANNDKTSTVDANVNPTTTNQIPAEEKSNEHLYTLDHMATNGGAADKEDPQGGGTAEMKMDVEVFVGEFPQGEHKEVGKDDDDITTTAILTSNNGNTNSIDGSAVKANVPATKTDTPIINNGDSGNVNANANFNNDGKSTVNANDNPTTMAIYTGDNPTDVGSSTDNQNDSGNIKISTVVPANDNGNANSIKGSAVDANTTATDIKDKESDCQRKCYCCFDEQLTKFNLEHGFVKNAPAIFNASTGSFPGYLPLHTVSTNTKDKKAWGLFIEKSY